MYMFHLLLSFLYLCVSSGILSSNAINRIFSRHGKTQMKIICEALEEYALIESNRMKGSDKLMFENMASNIRAGLNILETSGIDMIYFGWPPLNDNDIFENIGEPTRNDNDASMVETIHIPLYFIFVRIKVNGTMIVERIFHNPTIDVNINPIMMKEHLDSLCVLSNTTLDISPLKNHDNGRWYLILSDIFNFKRLPDI